MGLLKTDSNANRGRVTACAHIHCTDCARRLNKCSLCRQDIARHAPEKNMAKLPDHPVCPGRIYALGPNKTGIITGKLGE